MRGQSMKDVSKALKDLLRTESLKSPITRHCPDCGSVMEYVAIKFFAGESDEIWDIPLPVCFKCVSPAAKQSFVKLRGQVFSDLK